MPSHGILTGASAYDAVLRGTVSRGNLVSGVLYLVRVYPSYGSRAPLTLDYHRRANSLYGVTDRLYQAIQLTPRGAVYMLSLQLGSTAVHSGDSD
jgi:hypothetical protein